MDDKVKEKLKNLFVLYKKNLPGKIEHIEAQWQKMLDHWEQAPLETLHRDVHSLCGSSATYGYLQLGKIARQVEILLKDLLGKEEPSGQEKNLISKHITQLKPASLESTDAALDYQMDLNQEPFNNKLVYVLEENGALTLEIIETLRHMGYESQPVADVMTLTAMMREQPPVAIVMNCSYLTKESMDCLSQRNLGAQSIQLFCLVPSSDLLPRLLAVRAGCDAFFQLPLDVSYFAQVVQSKCSTSTEHFRILIVDDSETLAEYYSLILTNAGMITRVLTNPLELLNVWKSFHPDLLLMDIYMPECTGLELAAVLRLEATYTKTPIIFLSTEDNRNKILFAISLGGEDFLSKPVSPQHLVSAVRARAKRASALNYYMVRDSLTGLLNHSSVITQLDIELARAMLKDSLLTVMMIDVDYFKKINDTYGHLIGDKVLKQLANLFLVYLRNQDIVGRYGGEEFMILLPGTSINDAERICNELRVQFSQYAFKDQEQTFHCTFSAGISFFQDEKEAAYLIQEADEALYEAKNKGRNQVVVYQKS